jgi:hypothetical protein
MMREVAGAAEPRDVLRLAVVVVVHLDAVLGAAPGAGFTLEPSTAAEPSGARPAVRSQALLGREFRVPRAGVASVLITAVAAPTVRTGARLALAASADLIANPA